MASNTKAGKNRGKRKMQEERPSGRRTDCHGERHTDRRTENRGERPSDRRSAKLQKQKRRKKKMIAILAAEAVLLLVLCGGLWVLSKLGKLQNLDVNPGDIEMNEMDAATAELLKGYTNIALFGIDTREMGDLGAGNRSDTMMIASINNETKEVRLVSVYRDTYLNKGDDSYGKCNGAYTKGGPAQAIAMLNTNFDLNIKYYVSVDFLALIKTVDALGGLEVDVKENEWEGVNAYMYETAEKTEEAMGEKYTTPFLEGPGLQTLDGLQVTSYCRIRKGAGDDFGRTERQRKILTLIAEKAKSASLGTINKIIDEVFPLVATNIPYTEMLGMAAGMLSYEIGETAGFPSKFQSADTKDGDTLIPQDLEYNVAELHRFLFGEEDYYPSPTVIRFSDKISADTGIYAEESTE